MRKKRKTDSSKDVLSNPQVVIDAGSLGSELTEFRVQLISLIKSRVLVHLLPGIETSFSVTQKIDFILSNKPPALRQAIGRVKKNDLEKLHRKYVLSTPSNNTRNHSHDSLTNELFQKFLGNLTSLEKRIREDKNIKSLGDPEKELSCFFELCGIVIPNEILSMILDYLPQNLSCLVNVGRLCQHFYLKLLTSWKHVKITRTNIYSISLLVFRNVPHIELEKLTKIEREYVIEHINPQKLRKLTVRKARGSNSFVDAVLKDINDLRLEIYQKRTNPKRKGKKKFLNITTYPFLNITELNLATCPHFNLKKMFPKLGSLKIGHIGGFNHPFKFFRINKGLGVHHLDMTGYFHGSYFRSIASSGCTFSNLRSLKVAKVGVFGRKFCNSSSFHENFHALLEKCEKLEELEFIIDSDTYWDYPMEKRSFLSERTESNHHLHFKMYDFFQTPKFKKLKIRQHEGKNVVLQNSKKSVHTRPDNFAVRVGLLFHTSLEELEIVGSKLRNKDYCLVDFNLEEILKEQFFVSNTHLKVFKGDLSLSSRRTRFEEGAMKKVKSGRDRIVGIVSQFFSCFEDTLIPNLQKLDLKIRNGDDYFKDELLHFRMDKYVVAGSSHCVKRLWVKYVEKFYDEPERDSIGGEKIFQDDLIVEKRKPCLYFFSVFLRKVVEMVEQGVVDLVMIDSWRCEYGIFLKSGGENESLYRKSRDCEMLKEIRSKFFDVEMMSNLRFVDRDDKGQIVVERK